MIESTTVADISKKLVPSDTDVEYSTACARLLNAHEANYAAFKKAVANMVSIIYGQKAEFVVSIDSERCKLSVSANVDSLHVYRDLLSWPRFGTPDDSITAFDRPLKELKIRSSCLAVAARCP